MRATASSRSCSPARLPRRGGGGGRARARAAGGGAGCGLLAAPLGESEPARRMAIAGAGVELLCEQLLERRLGMVAETLHTGTAGRGVRAGRALTGAGAL